MPDDKKPRLTEVIPITPDKLVEIRAELMHILDHPDSKERPIGFIMAYENGHGLVRALWSSNTQIEVLCLYKEVMTIQFQDAIMAKAEDDYDGPAS